MLYASDFVTDGKYDEQGEDTKWDLIVESIIQLKKNKVLDTFNSSQGQSFFTSDSIMELIQYSEGFIQTRLFDTLLFDRSVRSKFTEVTNIVFQYFFVEIKLRLKRFA